MYVSDFGLSKSSLGTGGLTGSGQFLGTVDYAAPEQISGRKVDGRADQYALGCTAYELLSGQPPFRRDQGLAVVYAHLSSSPPSLTERRPDLPADADTVFRKVLAKDPAERYGSCQEFTEALRSALRIAPPDGETGAGPVLAAAGAASPAGTVSAVGPGEAPPSPAAAAAGSPAGPHVTVTKNPGRRRRLARSRVMEPNPAGPGPLASHQTTSGPPVPATAGPDVLDSAPPLTPAATPGSVPGQAPAPADSGPSPAAGRRPPACRLPSLARRRLIPACRRLWPRWPSLTCLWPRARRP